jgi:hypothetical protein
MFKGYMSLLYVNCTKFHTNQFVENLCYISNYCKDLVRVKQRKRKEKKSTHNLFQTTTSLSMSPLMIKISFIKLLKKAKITKSYKKQKIKTGFFF